MKRFSELTDAESLESVRDASDSARSKSGYMRAEEMETEERQLKLMRLQNRMQGLWNKIEWNQREFDGGTSNYAGVKQSIENMTADFAKLEIEERKLLRPGFPLTQAAKEAMR